MCGYKGFQVSLQEGIPLISETVKVLKLTAVTSAVTGRGAPLGEQNELFNTATKHPLAVKKQVCMFNLIYVRCMFGDRISKRGIFSGQKHHVTRTFFFHKFLE